MPTNMLRFVSHAYIQVFFLVSSVRYHEAWKAGKRDIVALVVVMRL